VIPQSDPDEKFFVRGISQSSTCSSSNSKPISQNHAEFETTFNIEMSIDHHSISEKKQIPKSPRMISYETFDSQSVFLWLYLDFVFMRALGPSPGELRYHSIGILGGAFLPRGLTLSSRISDRFISESAIQYDVCRRYHDHR
jgi:hypothetical protein